MTNFKQYAEFFGQMETVPITDSLIKLLSGWFELDNDAMELLNDGKKHGAIYHVSGASVVYPSGCSYCIFDDPESI